MVARDNTIQYNHDLIPQSALSEIEFLTQTLSYTE